MSEFAVAVIGAGPAGLGCVTALANAGFRDKILVVDIGRHHHRRTCPVDAGKHCSGCRNVCNVISGFGGSMHYGDSLKLSRLPAGRRLLKILGEQRAGYLFDNALASLKVEDATFREPPLHAPIALKRYPVAVLAANAVARTIDQLYAKVSSTDGLELRLETAVTHIQRDEDGYVLDLQSRKEREQVRAKKVVVSVGRKGWLWWRNVVRQLELRRRDPTISFGLRFEGPAELLRAAAACHPDYKVSVREQDFKFKTFCFCAGPKGGRIKLTDYGAFTLLDGHAAGEGDHNYPTANFALLMQLCEADGAPRSFDWVYRNLLAPYIALNSARPGKPCVQSYSDFRSDSLKLSSLTEIQRATGHCSSVADLQPARLSSLLPAAVRQATCTVFEGLLHDYAKLGGYSRSDALGQFTVLGLELESVWDELVIDENFQTTSDGLYASGDCAGVAQGVLQAFVSGMAAAEGILQ